MVEVARLAGLMGVMPAVISLAFAWLLLRSGHESGRRFAFAIPTALAFLVAYGLHPDRLPLAPERHWQWIVYLALGTSLVGGALASAGVPAVDRGLALAAVFVGCAWQLTPLWETLQPPRMVMIPLLAGYLWLIAFAPSLLPPRLRGRTLLVALAGVMLAVAMYVTVEVSLKVGLSLVPAAAALGGTWLAALLTTSLTGGKKDANSFDVRSLAVVGLLPVFAVLAGGGAFVGAIELPEPRWLLLLIPAAPLTLWLFAFGPLAKLTGWSAAIAQVSAVALIPAAILAWSLLQSEPADEWSYGPDSPKLLLNLRNRAEVEPVVGGDLPRLGPLQ